tara:strand:+ start:2310 stop:2960 length:651 start_codon:yes stop_codon:yes gene_type:complete
MDTLTIITSAITAIFGAGGVGAYFKYANNKIASIAEQQAMFTAQLIEETSTLREAVSARDSHIIKLQAEVRTLTAKVSQLSDQLDDYESRVTEFDAKDLLEQVFNSLDFPAWIHSVSENRWYVNDTYAETFSCFRQDFWTPLNVLANLPSGVASQYISNNIKAIEQNAGLVFEEEFVCNGDSSVLSVAKYPLTAGGRKYVLGCAKTGSSLWGKDIN